MAYFECISNPVNDFSFTNVFSLIGGASRSYPKDLSINCDNIGLDLNDIVLISLGSSCYNTNGAKASGDVTITGCDILFNTNFNTSVSTHSHWEILFFGKVNSNIIRIESTIAYSYSTLFNVFRYVPR